MKLYPENLRAQLGRLREKIQPDDDLTRSRANLLAFCCVSGIVGNLIGGNFFTGIMLYLDATTTQLGLTNIIAYVCNLLQLFSPLLLEHFAKRKKLLISILVAERVLNIVCISLATILPFSGQVRVYLILLCTAIINIINTVWSPGASVWHIQSVPEYERAHYFSLNQRLCNVTSYIFLLSASALTDHLKNAGHELEGYLLLRIVAAAFCIWEIWLLTRIKEYPYEKGTPIKLKSIFVEPFKAKRYLLSISVLFLWNLVATTTSSYFSVYLLDYVKINYLTLNVISACYVPILLLTMPFWNKYTKKHSWFNICWKCLFLYGFFCVAQMLVVPGRTWIYAASTIVLHLISVGINLSFANLNYYNIPRENQTIYMAFLAVVTNLAALCGSTYATRFATAFDGHIFHVIGMELQTGQFMQMVTGFLIVGMSLLVLALDKYEVKKYGAKVVE